MFLTKLISTLVVVAALGTTGAGVGMIATRGGGAGDDLDPTRPGAVALQSPIPAEPQPESPPPPNQPRQSDTQQTENSVSGDSALLPPTQPRRSAGSDNQPISSERVVDSNPANDRQIKVDNLNANQTTSPAGSLSAPTVDTGPVRNVKIRFYTGTPTRPNASPIETANQNADRRRPNTYLKPNASLNRTPDSYSLDVYTIEGDVVKPGRYALRKGVRVMDALNLAGGFQSKGVNQIFVRKLKDACDSIPDLAQEDRDVFLKVSIDMIQEWRKNRGFWKATLIRPSKNPIIPEQTLPIYVQAIAHGEDTTNYLIKPGDRIILQIEEDHAAQDYGPPSTRPDHPRTSGPDRPPVTTLPPQHE